MVMHPPRARRIQLAVGVWLIAWSWSPSACVASPTEDESGLQGVVLRGPVSPGPQKEGEASDEPFSALFHVQDSREREVARFRSDVDGRFRVALRQGRYIVVPDETAPLLFPTRQKREVTVPEGEYAEVTLVFDTGLR